MPANQPFAEYASIPTYSRHPKPATGEDGFFAETLASSITIPSVCTLRLIRLQSPLPSLPPAWPSPTAPPHPIPVPGADLLMILQLASPGVCGHPETAHGGVLATVLDEAMSLGVSLYAPEAGEQQTPDPVRTVHAAGGSASESRRRIRSKMFTAQLDVRYKRPVSVPMEIQARVQVLAKQGKKVWVRAQIVQRDEIMVDAMAFWLLTAPSGKSVL
ncbi:HotDog domain-containing protein [Aspergillus aurantiobrunneus]